jgi:hypothetical protein
VLSRDENSDALRSEEDLEEALAHAERMLASYDQAGLEFRMVQLAQAGTIVAGVLVAVAIAAFGLHVSSGQALVLALAVVPLAVAAGVAARCQQLLRAVQTQRRRDLFGLVELSRLVRELLPDVADTHRWSDVRHLTMRARLARFPISEERS